MELDEDTRDEFFKFANVDLENLSAEGVRELLALLPRVLVYLHTRFDMSIVFEKDAES
jgi:hypothetical protein